MTNNDEPIKLTGVFTEGERMARRLRPPTYFDALTFESRGIEQIAEIVQERCEDLYAECIDPEFNPGWSDEESEAFIQNRHELLVVMVCQSLLGHDKVVA